MDARTENPQQPDVQKPVQEIAKPKLKITERIIKLANFAKSPKSMENPDLAFQTIVNGAPKENNISPEQQAQLEEAGRIITGLRNVRETLLKVKDNEVVGGITIAGLGLLASFVGMSDNLNMISEVAATGVLSGGSKGDIVKNIGLGLMSVGGKEVTGNLPLEGVEEAATNLYEVGQKKVEQVVEKGATKVLSRFRMTKVPS